MGFPWEHCWHDGLEIAAARDADLRLLSRRVTGSRRNGERGLSWPGAQSTILPESKANNSYSRTEVREGEKEKKEEDIVEIAGVYETGTPLANVSAKASGRLTMTGW